MQRSNIYGMRSLMALRPSSVRDQYQQLYRMDLVKVSYRRQFSSSSRVNASIWERLFRGSSNSVEGSKSKDSKKDDDSLFSDTAPRSEIKPEIFDRLDRSVEITEKRERELARMKQRNKSQKEIEEEELDRKLDGVSADETLESQETRKAILRKEDDAQLREIISPKPKSTAEQYLSPLQFAVYQKQLTGVDNELTVGRNLRLKLTKRERELLEPSVYLKSHTQSGSVKKVTPFLRSLRGMQIHRAIAHCHFSVKRVSIYLEKLLLKGIEDAKALGLKETELYIDQIWSGKEPKPLVVPPKMVDYMGRGRAGMKIRREHHTVIVLKTSATKIRKEEEKQKKAFGKKPWVQLENKPIYNKSGAHYNW
ncbi:hypothetical protein V1511DRAFT_532755 [Dipodascopsis uninucleata]